MPDEITLTRAGLVAEENQAGKHSWPLRVTAVSTVTGLSSKIFVYHAQADDFEGDVFECIASLPQMGELPEDRPASSSTDSGFVPYYRKDVALFNCRCADEADQLWEDIQEDVQDLLDNFRAASSLTTVETVTIS